MQRRPLIGLLTSGLLATACAKPLHHESSHYFHSRGDESGYFHGSPEGIVLVPPGDSAETTPLRMQWLDEDGESVPDDYERTYTGTANSEFFWLVATLDHIVRMDEAGRALAVRHGSDSPIHFLSASVGVACELAGTVLRVRNAQDLEVSFTLNLRDWLDAVSATRTVAAIPEGVERTTAESVLLFTYTKGHDFPSHEAHLLQAWELSCQDTAPDAHPNSLPVPGSEADSPASPGESEASVTSGNSTGDDAEAGNDGSASPLDHGSPELIAQFPGLAFQRACFGESSVYFAGVLREETIPPATDTPGDGDGEASEPEYRPKLWVLRWQPDASRFDRTLNVDWPTHRGAEGDREPLGRIVGLFVHSGHLATLHAGGELLVFDLDDGDKLHRWSAVETFAFLGPDSAIYAESSPESEVSIHRITGFDPDEDSVEATP